MKSKRSEGSHVINYEFYRFSKQEWSMYAAGYCALDGVVSLLFYKSWFAFVILLPGIIFFLKDRRQVRRERRKKKLESQFLTGMQAVSNALGAGYSMENAFKEALYEVQKIYGAEELIVMEFQNITKMLALNKPLEGLLKDLGRRSDTEDIESFAEVFSAARRSGGDLIAIIRNTVSSISQKEEMRKEIQVCIAAKKMEQNVMSIVPIFILCYVGLTSPGFLDSMYYNAAGIAVMTVCLAVYIAAWYLGRRIVDIEV